MAGILYIETLNPIQIRQIFATEVFKFLVDQYTRRNIQVPDFIAFLEESLNRLNVDADLAIKFFRTRIFEVAEYVADKFGKPPPLPFTAGENTPRLIHFRNFHCHDVHKKIVCVMEGVHQLLLNDSHSVGKFQHDLENSPRIVVTHHEPPSILPRAPNVDMISIRTMNYISHCLLIAAPSFNKHVIQLLKNYAPRGSIFGHGPRGLLRYLKDSFDWVPDIIDTKPIVHKMVGGSSSFVDITRCLFGSPFCL